MNKIWLLLVTSFCFICLDVGYADTEINIGLSETYSSNISLLPSSEAESDFVTRISPSLAFTRSGRIADVNIDYTYETLIYADNSTFNEDFHQLNSNALLRLIGEELILSGDVGSTQVNVDPLMPQTSSNILKTGNRSDSLYWSGGPRWRGELPLNSAIDASYRYGHVGYDDPGIQEVDTEIIAVRLFSDENSGGALTYELEYNKWSYDYETTGDVDDQNLAFYLRQKVGEGFNLVGMVGLDSDFSDLQDSTLSEGRWEVGIDSSSMNWHLEAMFGHRYFGSVFRLRADREVADWGFSVSYSEIPGTTESVFLQGGISQMAVEDESLVDDPMLSGLDRPGTSSRFLQKRADSSVHWSGLKSSIALTLWWDQRDYMPDENVVDPSLADDEESVGASLVFDWEMGAHTATNLSASWVLRDLSGLDPDNDQLTVMHNIDTWHVGAGVSYQLGLKTSLGSTIAYRHSSGREQEDGYDEFQALIELSRVF